MKRIISTCLIFCFATFLAFGQTLLSSQYLGSRTKQQLQSQYFIFTIKNGVNIYKVTYETPNAQGTASVASGLLVVPDNLTKVYPMLAYNHGTSSSRMDVPSNQNGESALPIVFGGLGYLTIAPDYLGLGESPGFHPYVHAGTEASVGVDGLRAAREFANGNGVSYNEQVFLTGYSQGGHASMALHQSLEQDYSSEFAVTAAAHLSGPYSISGVMRELLLADVPYGRPAYLVNTMFSYQYVYGNLYNDISEAVKPAYIAKTEQYFAGSISLVDLNDFLITELTANEGGPIASRMFVPDFVAAVESDPNHPVNLALQDNDLFDWMAIAPTRLYYCTGDDQVPYQNSLIAETAMLAANSVNVDAVDVNTFADHVGCVTPALFNTVNFFAIFQSVTDVQVSAVTSTEASFEMYPNPADELLFVKNSPAPGELRLVDLHGRVQLRQPIAAGDNQIRIDGLQSGFYFLDFQGESGNFRTKLMVIK